MTQPLFKFPSANFADKPLEQLKKYSKNEPLSAKKLNKTVNTINQIIEGVKSPRQSYGSAASGTVTYWQATETKTASDETINVKQITKKDGTLSTTERSVNKITGQAIRSGDRMFPVRLQNNKEVYVADAGWRDGDEYTIPNGSGTTAETTEYDPLTNSAQVGNAIFRALTRMYYDDTSGKLYAFERDYTIDRSGNIIKATAETRRTVFTAASCP